jgi:hypothetical protein
MVVIVKVLGIMFIKNIKNQIIFSAYDLNDLEFYQIIGIVFTSLPLNYPNTYIVLIKYSGILTLVSFLVKGS